MEKAVCRQVLRKCNYINSGYVGDCIKLEKKLRMKKVQKFLLRKFGRFTFLSRRAFQGKYLD